MSLLNKDWAVARCADVFASAHCEPVVSRIWAWFEGGAIEQMLSLVVAVLSLVVAVKALSLARIQTLEARQRHAEEKQKQAEDEREKLKVVPKNSIDLRHCVGDELAALRQWFEHLQEPPSQAPAAPAATSWPGSVQLVAEVDAERHFWVAGMMRGMMRPEGNLRVVHDGFFRSHYALGPTFLSWADNGEEILVACDAHGARRYGVSGDKLGSQPLHDHYEREPMPSAYSPDRAWCRWAVQPHSGLSLCYSSRGVIDELVVHLPREAPLRIDLARTGLSVGGLDAIWSAEGFGNPWRPGHRQLLLMDTAGRAEREGGARAIGVFDVAELQKSGTTLGRQIIHRYELDHVLPPGHYVQGYAWHDSGHFIAVASSRNYAHEPGTRRVMVFDRVLGRVLAASAWARYLVGWMPGASQLLLGCAPAEQSPQAWDFVAWDPVSQQETPLAQDDAAPAVRRMMLGFVEQRSPDRGLRQLNADARLWLDARWQHLCVSPVGEPGQECRIPHEGRAAWSPTDPRLFASVGRIDGKAALRLWRVGEAA